MKLKDKIIEIEQNQIQEEKDVWQKLSEYFEKNSIHSRCMSLYQLLVSCEQTDSIRKLIIKVDKVLRDYYTQEVICNLVLFLGIAEDNIKRNIADERIINEISSSFSQTICYWQLQHIEIERRINNSIGKIEEEVEQTIEKIKKK
ncbi:MAG: hypothetical protein LUG18_09640 [Candidatus Azobacteroides sp.]|nr:hypothetical protein [Candidatus Azobacteroides sp.]